MPSAARSLTENKFQPASRLRFVHDPLRAAVHVAWRQRRAAPRIRDALRARTAVRRQRSGGRAAGGSPCAIAMGSTRSAPGERSHGRWRPSSRDLLPGAQALGLRFGDGEGLLATRSARSRIVKAPATCWPKARGAPRRRRRQQSASGRCTSRASSCPGYDPRSLKTMALGLGRQSARRVPQPVGRVRSRFLRRGGSIPR